MILLMMLTASVGLAAANDEDKVLKKGDVAPYYGVLIDEVHYRKFVDAENTQIEFYQRMAELERLEVGILKQEKKWYMYFTYGFLSGLFLTIAAQP